jgi:poly(A) polymerase
VRRIQTILEGREVLAVLPHWLRRHLARLLLELGGELYLAGGVVRDLLLGLTPADIDLTVPAGATIWAAKLAALTGGAYVALGRGEDAARVVSGATTIDFSSYREGAATIEEDLRLRDLTVNALALRLDPLLADPATADGEQVALIDPAGGREDLAQGLIRIAGPESFSSDPLRLLRVFRFAAGLGFTVDADTLAQVARQRELLARPAPERIAHELDLIMASNRACAAVAAMAETGLLWAIIPELAAGIDMAQPESHHLDVWRHNLETLCQIGRVLEAPEAWFPHCGQEMAAYLGGERRRQRLQWAALLHDLGKPATFAVNPAKGDRITFYNHDRAGSEMFRAFARRLRWSNEDTERVAHLIREHMRPFHLANVARTGHLTLRAAIRLIRKAGGDLPGLFILAMADSLAGQGVARIEDMERELAELYAHLERVRVEHVEPVRSGKPLLTGRDLIDVLHLPPGPLFKRLLVEVEEARMEGRVADYEGALQLVKTILAGNPVETKKKIR